MSQIVTDAAGQNHEFPDGTTPQQMEAALRQHADQQAGQAQARAQGRDSWGNVAADSLTTGVEAVKGAGRALMSPLTALLHPQDTWQGMKDMGTAASEAVQHPSEIGPAFLQGAADPQVMGNAIGSAAVALAPKVVPMGLRALKSATGGSTASMLNAAATGADALAEVKHPTLGMAAKGLRYAAGKIAPEAEAAPAPRPRLTGRGTMSPVASQVEPRMPNTGMPKSLETLNAETLDGRYAAQQAAMREPDPLQVDRYSPNEPADWENYKLPDDLSVEGGLDMEGPNASGQPGGATGGLEHLKRAASMADNGDTYVVRRPGGGEFPAHADYQVRPGETFGIKDSNGALQVLDRGEADLADQVPGPRANPVVSRSLNDINGELEAAHAGGDQAAIEQLTRARRQANVIRRKAGGQ